MCGSRGRKGDPCTESYRARGGHAAPAMSHCLSPLAVNHGEDGQGKIPIWLVKRDGCSGYGGDSKQAFTLAHTYRPREDIFSAIFILHWGLRQYKEGPTSSLDIPFLGLLAEINSPTIPRDSEKACLSFDHLLEGGKI